MGGRKTSYAVGQWPDAPRATVMEDPYRVRNILTHRTHGEFPVNTIPQASSNYYPGRARMPMVPNTPVESLGSVAAEHPWVAELAGILPLSALLDFTDVPTKLHIFQLIGAVPLWSWPITPSGSRLLLSFDTGNDTNAHLDRFGNSLALTALDGRYGDNYLVSSPGTLRLCLESQQASVIENLHNNMKEEHLQIQYLEVVHVTFGTHRSKHLRDHVSRVAHRSEALHWGPVGPRARRRRVQGIRRLPITFWIVFCILAHVLLITPQTAAREWLRSCACIELRRYRAQLSSRRALLNTIMALNPDTFLRSEITKQEDRSSFYEDALKWIDPILARGLSRTRWENATREAMEAAARCKPDELTSTTWQSANGDVVSPEWNRTYHPDKGDYWRPAILEGIHMAERIKRSARLPGRMVMLVLGNGNE
ncbi:hypothetical protein DL768_010850 [Monosporascus sp. mg162]|nr:hypothetical protein DL768_010850 [Monosporascus sp. mg162]